GRLPVTSGTCSRRTRRRGGMRRNAWRLPQQPALWGAEGRNAHERPDREHGAALLEPRPRGGALLHGARCGHAAAALLRRVSTAAREDEPERDRVRNRRDPARRL